MQRRSKLLLCIIGISVYIVVNAAARKAIVNGNVPNPARFPYQVSVQHEDGTHLCGGGIIDPESILTAAHCMIGSANQFEDSRRFVLAGTSDLNKTGWPAVRLQVRTIYVPKEYYWRNRIGDIAVLKLNGGLRMRGYIDLQSLELPRKKFDQDTELMARIAGWGWNWVIEQNDNWEIGGRNTTELRDIKVKVLTVAECKHHGPANTDYDRQFCARAEQHRDGHSVCMFDNGSPLVHEGVVIGVLSRIPPGCRETQTPGIYTLVAHYSTFIKNSLNNRATLTTHVHHLPHD